MGNPPQRHFNNNPHNRPLLPHQHRLHHRLQPNHLPRPLRPPLLLSRLNLLHGTQANSKRAVTPIPLQVRETWSTDQYLRHRLLAASIYFYLFPADAEPSAGFDELECGYLCGCIGDFGGLLCRYGETSICGACGVCEEGVVGDADRPR